MSRFHDDGDECGMPNELWQANVERAIRGKRGQKVLRELRDALLALPEPRLIEGALCTVDPASRLAGLGNGFWQREMTEFFAEHGEGVCANGAWLWHQMVRGGMTPGEAFAALPTLPDNDSELSDTACAAVSAGMTFTLAWDLAMRNDETYGEMTPEDRYTAFLAWIDGQLGAESVPADA